MFKWLDLSKLPKLFTPGYKLRDIIYFTALVSWNPAKVKRHRIYIRALESKSVRVVYGQFRKRTHTCWHCRKGFETFEEKQTDVNIAIWLLRLAFEDQYDLAMIISGDSDLIPSIQAIKSAFPGKEVGIIIPIGRRAEELKETTEADREAKAPSQVQVLCKAENSICRTVMILAATAALHLPEQFQVRGQFVDSSCKLSVE